MKKILSLILVVLLLSTAGCKRVPKQDEVGALLPPEVSEDQNANEVPSTEFSEDQTANDAPSTELSEEKPSPEGSDEENGSDTEIQESAPIEKTVFNDGKNRAWAPISLEEFTRRDGICVEYIPTNHLSEIQEKYSLDKYVVFKGKKQGLITPIDQYHGLWEGFIPSHCETNLLVSEVFYGDIQEGTVITYKEDIMVSEWEGVVTYSMLENEEPVIENEEYLFILRKDTQLSSKGTALYGSVGMYCSSHKISEYDALKTKAQEKNAKIRETLSFEALDYYLNQPETKLDLRKEASKYLENIPENATDQEILQALPQEKKDLFERMIDQYGSVEQND